MKTCVSKPVLGLIGSGLSLGLLMLLAGCGSDARSVDHVEVTGKVLLDGKPLPGGKVTFVAVNGGFASSGTIDENGNYQINAPVGEAQIGVTNRMLQGRPGSKGGPPTVTKAEAKERQPLKGRWMKIPSHYEDPYSSGLKFTVKPGSQSHDIELSANSSPAAAASKK